MSSNVIVDREVIAWGPKLRVISTMSVGLDHIDVDAARAKKIVVTITPVLSDAVADLTMALMIMLSRRISEGMRAAITGRWNEVSLGSDLAGKRLLLVGFGRIGQAVARRALAAKMHVQSSTPAADCQLSMTSIGWAISPKDYQTQTSFRFTLISMPRRGT